MQQLTTKYTRTALTHFDVRLEALIQKKVAFDSLATALAKSVLPLPGGPNSSKPRAGARSPVKS